MPRRIVMLVVAFGLTGCGTKSVATTATTTQPVAVSTSAAPASSTSTAAAQTTTAQADPYVAFQALAKAQDLKVPADLDRESALARALLGCGTTWPPKTLDAALAQAYAVQIAQAKKQGHCG